MSIIYEHIKQQILTAFDEDVGSGDVTANLIDSDKEGIGDILCRQPMVVCGQAWVEACFHHCSSHIDVYWLVREGEFVSSAQKLCEINGPLASILTAERTALNFFQTLSATATQTKQYVDRIAGTGCQILDTRKTIPGLRSAQKYAVSIGGGINHRFGLYDAFLIKENHIMACGSMTAAVERAKQGNPTLFLEVEVENLEQLKEALSLSIDRIMLDNFSISDIRKAIALRGEKSCQLEVSGSVCLNTVTEIAETGVDFISVGAITKSIDAIDLSLRLRER